MSYAPFAANAPLSFVANPIPTPKTAIGREALKLYQAAVAAAEQIQNARDVSSAAATGLTEARTTYQAEVERGGREGQDADRERELALAVAARELEAKPEVHHVRYGAAVRAQREAVERWTVFIRDNLSTLIGAEMENEAQRASAELVKARTALAPVENAYAEIHERSRLLIETSIAGHPNADQLRAQWTLAPVPEAPLPDRALWDSSSDTEAEGENE